MRSELKLQLTDRNLKPSPGVKIIILLLDPILLFPKPIISGHVSDSKD